MSHVNSERNTLNEEEATRAKALKQKWNIPETGRQPGWLELGGHARGRRDQMTQVPELCGKPWITSECVGKPLQGLKQESAMVRFVLEGSLLLCGELPEKARRKQWNWLGGYHTSPDRRWCGLGLGCQGGRWREVVDLVVLTLKINAAAYPWYNVEPEVPR